MIYRHLRNVKGFFSDYYLGGVFGQGSGRGRKRRLSDRDTDAAYRRFMRIYEGAEGRAPDRAICRERFIRPLVRDVLGYHLGGGEEHIYGLYASAEAEAAGDLPLMLCYCGAWGEDLDAGRGGANPVKRLRKTMATAHLGHAFLITGERIRLVRPTGEGPVGSHLEVDLASLTGDEDPESFAAFYHLFHVTQYRPSEDGALPIDRVEEESRRHAEKVSDDLKRVVFTSAETLVAALIDDKRQQAPQGDPPDIDDQALKGFRDSALLAIYRMLFILYAEARDERLQQHSLYWNNYSIHRLVENLLHRPPCDWPENRASLWSRFKALFYIYDQGLPRIDRWDHIPPRGSDFFKSTTPAGTILHDAALSDRKVARLLLDLTTTQPRRGVGRERISFRELDIENLGAVYEGLLEYEPRLADGTLIELRIQGRNYILNPAEAVRLCNEKTLTLKGNPALVANTEAEVLHPAYAEEEDAGDGEQELAGEEEAEDENAADDTSESVKKGAPARLLRRFETGDFYFVPGTGRKGSGSFYTPLPLVQDLVRHALGPLVEEETAAEIENLRVLDAACGSAHFLVEAMRFLGRELHRAYVKEYNGKRPPQMTHGDWDDNWKVSDEQARAANSEARAWCKRRIAERCLFGVDLNPTAVQLARVALWIESLAGDRPLSYFEHHVRCGNSLLGSWLARMGEPPLPALAGKKQDATPQDDLFGDVLERKVAEAAAARRLIDHVDVEALRQEGVEPESVEVQTLKDNRRRKAEEVLRAARLLFDLRSAAAFVPEIWPDWATLYSLISDEQELLAYAQGRYWWEAFTTVRDRERFFHWELEFPEVFLDSDKEGFDVILGNPPWDKVLPTKHEFYGRYDVLIRAYKGNDLERRIRELHAKYPGLAAEFGSYRERAKAFAKLLRQSGDFPLAEARSQAAHEDVSKYFLDRALSLAAPSGTAGLVVPSVIYNGDGCVGIRRYLLQDATVLRFYGFENRKKVFPIDSRYKFVNLVVRKESNSSDGFTAAFMRHDLAELAESQLKPWEVHLTRAEIERLSPETFAFLEYRSPRDQEIVNTMYRDHPALGSEGLGNWGVRMFTDLAHMQIYNGARDKDLFTNPSTGKLHTPNDVLGANLSDTGNVISRMCDKGYWPVFEGKHVDQYLVGTKPIRWWLSVAQAEVKHGRAPRKDAALVYRETASNTNERTCIAAVLPSMSAASHKLTGLLLDNVDPEAAVVVLNSFCFDYALRMRTAGTNVSFTYMRPMPVPPADVVNKLPSVSTKLAWECGLEHITEDKDLWPVLWKANRAVAEAYDLTPGDFEHILSTFPVFARKRPEFFAYLQERLAEWKGEMVKTTAAIASKTKTKGASKPFRQAAVFAWVVSALYHQDYPVSRYRAGKMIYLVERAQELRLFQSYLKQAAGPYDPKLRYGGPENIAVQQRQWLKTVDNSHFEPGPKIQEAFRYAQRYLDIAQAANVVQQFGEYQDSTLSRWTTVDMAARELAANGASVTVDTVLERIGEIPEWEQKLERDEFTPELIGSTLLGLRKYGYLNE